ncbi:Fatty acid-binding protein, partial [Neolecta irregularis DAH-3]
GEPSLKVYLSREKLGFPLIFKSASSLRLPSTPIMSLKNPDFPSSATFEQISQRFKDESTRKEAMKKANAIFAFELSNKDKKDQWYIDLKNTGQVGKGASPSKPDCTLILDDETFGKLASGQANAQKLFMTGGLKIKGNIMASTKLQAVLNSVQKSKL